MKSDRPAVKRAGRILFALCTRSGVIRGNVQLVLYFLHPGACGRVVTLAILCSMRKKMTLPFLCFLLLALFPYGWLAHLWPTFGLFINWLFETEMAHHIGHSLIFATLGWFLITVWPPLANYFALYLMLIGGLGLSQELLQLWYKQRPLGVNDGQDLLVDIAAAALFFVLYRHLIIRRASGYTATPLQRF